MKAELRDSLDNLYADAVIGARPVRRMSIDVARGGIAAVHILLNGLAANEPIRFSVRQGGRPVAGARWFRLMDVPVEENTGRVGFTVGSPNLKVVPYDNVRNAPNPFVVRRAPFRTYDAMQPVAGRLEPSAPTLALRLHVPIAPVARSGVQPYDVVIDHAGAVEKLRLTVTIHRAVVPESGRATLPYTNWFSFENIASRHGLTMWTGGYWRMLKRYAKLMAYGRQNAFLIPLHVIFADTPKGPILNRERLRRIVKIFTEAGHYYIEGGHVAGRTGGEWEATSFDTAFTRVRATTPKGHAVLVSICRQLLAEVERNGWRPRWIQHVTDEPIPANAADYRMLVGMVHKYMPGLPILDATQDPALVGSVDIWCPQVQEYQRDRAEYEAQRRSGDRVWSYTCCFPGGPWLNRLLDEELLRPALVGWGTALFRLDGFLHWGFNQYRTDQDPFTESVLRHHAGGSNSLPPGDTHIAYPGADGPWSSLRLEAHREGFEDYELIQMLREKNPRRADAIVRMAIRGFDRYVKDTGKFRLARRALLKALDHE